MRREKRIDGKRRDELAALKRDVQWATTQLLTSPSYSQCGIFPLNNSQVEGYTDAHIFLQTVRAHALTELQWSLCHVSVAVCVIDEMRAQCSG